MKIYIVDITGKTPLYDASLVRSIHDLDGVDHQVELLSLADLSQRRVLLEES